MTNPSDVPGEGHTKGLSELLAKVQAATEADNALDVEIEIATFQPDRMYKAVRANAAGTKLIYTAQNGDKETCWAWDWTLNQKNRDLAIKALAAIGETK